MNIEEYLSELMSDDELSNLLSKQHYNFAHKLMPYIVENHFQDILNHVVNKTADSFVVQLWNEYSDDSMSEYNSLVYPTYHFAKPTEELELIYFVMPSPRKITEAAYTAILFMMDNSLPFQWRRSYFTLELGLAEAPYWVLGEWKNSQHINLGTFELEPTLENFLKRVVLEGENRWC
jgi:hypothetical protein